VWVVVEIIAAGACLACSEAIPPPFGVALGILVFIAITLPNVARRVSHSRATARLFMNQAYYNAKCQHCTFGSQQFRVKRDGTIIGWGKIPLKNRIAQKGSIIFHPDQGNIRRCPHCRGMGHTPKLRKGMESTERVEMVWPPKDGIPYAAEPFYEEEPVNRHNAEYMAENRWWKFPD